MSSNAQTEYGISYVDFRGRISSEGVEFIRRSGEHRTGFVVRYLNAPGEEGWSLAAVHPLRQSESSCFILQRPRAAVASAGSSPEAKPAGSQG